MSDEVVGVGMVPAPGRALGVAQMLGATLAFSTAGFFTRLILLDAPTLLFWRGVFAGLSVCSVTAWAYRGHVLASLRAMGWPGVVAAAVSAFDMTCFLWSLRLSSVAEVSVIYATAPLAAAALGWLMLGERAGWRVLVASVVSIAGVLVMVGGAGASAHWVGDALALLMTAGSALLMVLLRRYRDTPMLPAMGIGSFTTALVAIPWAAPMLASPTQVGWAALFGITQLGLGLMLMTLGARHVRATEAMLYSALDAPLAPLWVWLAFAETPSAATLLGGGIVMAAVLAFIASEAREERAPRVRGRPGI